MKKCTRCGEEKALAEFSARAAVSSGYRNQCKTCVNEIAKQSRDRIVSSGKEKAQAKNWKNNLWRSFKMTPEEWQALFDQQGGVCMYCGKPETSKLNGVVKRLAVDHDHRCCPSWKNSCGGCVRGLACANCNQLVGILENRADFIYQLQVRLGLRSEEEHGNVSQDSNTI